MGRSAIVKLPLLCVHGPSIGKLLGLQTWSSSILFYHQPPWPNGQGVGLLIRRLRVRVPQGVILCCIAICNFGTQQFASSPLLFLLRLPFQHRLLVSATALVFILCHIGEKPAPAKTCETHCRPFRGTCQSLFAKPIIRRHMPIIVHQGMSHFARVVKGVDLRSTAGNCAWVRTPQVTF